MSKLNKPAKISGIIITILILLGIIAYVLTEFVAEPFLKRKIRDNVQKFGDVEYIVNFEQLDLKPLSRTIYLHQMEIIPRKGILNISSDSYRILLDELNIEGIHIIDYLFNDKIKINKVTLPHGHLNMFSYLKSPKPTDKPDTAQVSGTVNIKEVQIETLEIHDGKLTINNVDDEAHNVLVSGFLTLFFKNMVFNLEENADRPFNFDDFAIKIRDLKGKTTDSLRSYQVGRVDLKQVNNEYYATIGDISLSTRTEKYNLADVLGHEGDWMDVKIPKLEIKKLDIFPFLAQQKFSAEILGIRKPEITIFRDKRAPFPDKEDTQLPYEFIKSVSFNFSIDTLAVTNGTITYEEHVEAMEKPGYITFNDLNVNISNVTNEPGDNGDVAYMHVNSNIMNSAPLTAEFTFPLKENATNTVEGSVGQTSLTAFNPMISQVGYAEIKSGTCHSMNFDFTYNEKHSDGTLIFKYDNLEVETISKNDGESGSIGQNVKTFLADFVIDDENTEEDLKEGKISYSRNPKKSVINYWWKSLLTGIRTSIGMSGELKEEKN